MPTSTSERKTTTRSTGANGADRGNVAGGAYTRARKAAEAVVDVPVGAVLVLTDRVGEIVEPWTGRDTASRELRTLRAQLRREMNRVERRGGTARRRAATRARRARHSAEAQLRKVPSRVSERVSALV